MPQTKIAVLGGRGLVGRLIVSALLTEHDFDLVVLTSRDPSTLEERNAKVKEYLQTDWSDVGKVAQSLKGCQVAVLCLSEAGGSSKATDGERPLSLFATSKTVLDAAVQAGVEHVVLSDFTADIQATHMHELLIYDDKIRTRAYAQTLASNGSLTWSSITCRSLMELGLCSGFLGFDASSKTVSLVDHGTNPFPMTSIRMLSAAIIALVRQRSTWNRTAYVADVFASQKQIWQLIEKHAGSETSWTEEPFRSELLLRTGLATLGSNPYEAYKSIIWAIFLGEQPRYRGLNAWEKEAQEDMRLLGLSADDTALEWVTIQLSSSDPSDWAAMLR